VNSTKDSSKLGGLNFTLLGKFLFDRLLVLIESTFKQLQDLPLEFLVALLKVLVDLLENQLSVLGDGAFLMA
jgi:hypothetical protein